MPDRDLLIIPGPVVRDILQGQEELVLNAVARAYLAHGAGQTRSPGTQPLYTSGGRFFAMPGSIEDARPMVGAKWVASFVGNVAAGGERASALLIASDAATGRPVAVVDGTLISAMRTAASAALAMRALSRGRAVESVALVGCGPINYEVLRFINHVMPLQRVHLVDTIPERIDAFSARVRAEFGSITPIASTLEAVLQTVDVVSLATNTSTPHIMTLPARPLLVLHISLRDLAPAVIAGASNIVDDIEHVCTARTSVHLAAEATGHRDFIHGTIPGLLAGTFHPAPSPGPTIVSPFGMAILDLAVLQEVVAAAEGRSGVTRVPEFGRGVWT